MRTIAIVPLLLLLVIGTSNAQETVSPHGVTFTLDPARTVPGTVEVEIGTLSGNSFDMPWVFKFTADSKNWLLRDIEWAFAGGVHGDSFTLFVRRPIYRTNRFVLAISPRINFPVRDKPLPGLAVLASYIQGLNGFVVNGEINQTAGIVRKAFYGDYARTLGTAGLRSKLVIFGGVLVESSESTSVSLGEGLAYRLKPNFEIEVGVRQVDLAGDRRFVLLTDFILNLGRIR